MKKLTLDNVAEKEYQEIVDLWEDSVRVTHSFLKEEDILFFKALVFDKYLYAVKLLCVRDADNKVLAFMGTTDKKIEMLFISPNYIGQGIGRLLMNHAIGVIGLNKVDVNEQNQQAVGFYRHLGFEVIGRSELDGMGKPYPILGMKLKQH